MGGYEKIGEHTFLLRGSPNTLFFVDKQTVYIIDPGHGNKRAKQIRSFAKNFSESYVLLTHSHSDHVNIAEKINAKQVYAPKEEISMLIVPRIRTLTTFGYPVDRGDFLLFEPTALENVHPVKQEVLPNQIRLLDLPGHSPAHKGFFITSDNIIYAGDAVFGERVIERYGVLYHFDSIQAMDSLHKLLELVDNDTVLVPSHGLALKGEDAKKLLELNVEKLELTINTVLNELNSPKTLTELSGILHRMYSLDNTAGSLMLIETGVKGIVSSLFLRGKVKPIVENNMLKWVTI